MRSIYAYLIVFLGAGVGGALRHGVNVGMSRVMGSAFPWGTVTVNVAGSLLMGLLAGWFALRADPGQHWRLFLTTGLLGGFTTFSAFCLDVNLLQERGDLGISLLYTAASVCVGVAGVFFGLWVMRAVS